jgi:hypothetical protein
MLSLAPGTSVRHIMLIGAPFWSHVALDDFTLKFMSSSRKLWPATGDREPDEEYAVGANIFG